MVFFSAAFGLFLQFLLWGAGLALLLTPRRWRVGWPALCAPAGIALQSAVVWFGARTSLPGAQSYASYSLALPGIFLAGGLWKAWIVERRNLWLELKQWQGVGLLSAIVLNALIIPFAVSSRVLTTSSLGSCDAADYAAGARTLLEFSRYDRSGFIGLTEVVRLHSVDNFFDHWIRLNHFTPSALLALNSAVMSARPFELVSVMSAVFVALSLPVVFWFARSTFRYGSVASFWIAAVYGFSPLLWYAVYHVAMSQMLAAIAIALLTGAAIALWNEGASLRTGWKWSGLLFVAFWLILGAYNFIVVVCLVPALAYVGAITLWRGEWRRLSRWFVLVLTPLALAAAVFTQRTLGLVERFVLFQQFDFGWRIPPLTPEGWLGILAKPSLQGFAPGIRWATGALVIILFVSALLAARRRKGMLALVAFSTTLPILAGYAFLVIRGILRHTNASYDAYKLFCVFYPGMLAGLAFWLSWTRSPNRILRTLSIGFALVVLGLNALSAHRFIRRMQSPPLIVDRSLADLQKLEERPEITSVNLRIPEFWSRLWANSFLLRKPQYFETYTYEGRRNTELKGDWDLYRGVLQVSTPESPVQPGPPLMRPLSLVPTHSPFHLTASWGDGWYETELLSRAGRHWRWSKGDASFAIGNPQSESLNVLLRLSVRSLVKRDLSVWLNGRELRRVEVGPDLRFVHVPGLSVPPGASKLEFRSSLPPLTPGPEDPRQLGFAVYGVDIEVVREGVTLRDFRSKLRLEAPAVQE
ncbi:hypothetical protein DB347_16285 [Opitutaceae bacterium EW11]|nr:hypothetical protein DB347_16285 [Opitutaceae bacterium EW11]